MLKYFFDRFTVDCIQGWCFDPDYPDITIQIVIYKDDVEIDSCMVDGIREDVMKQFDIKMPCGFQFTKTYTSIDLTAMKIYALYADHKEEIIPKQKQSKGYQSFKDQVGDSDSFAKLTKLKVPASMKNYHVLDIGCNEGFFCIDAKQRGATKIIGIDRNAQFIAKAKERDPDITYINDTWWNIPDEKFHLIYFLSAIHYEKNTKKLLDFLADHLTDNGRLILECGAITSTSQAQWFSVLRGKGSCKRYPSMTLLREVLLNKYKTRLIGESVKQPGDPVPRYVLHCYRKKTTVILVKGKSNLGKSTIAKDLSISSNIYHFSIDSVLALILKTKYQYSTDIYNIVRAKCTARTVGNFIDKLDENEIPLLVDAVLDMIPFEIDYIIIEGYFLYREEIYNLFLSKLQEKNVRVWDLNNIYK